jgi:hypothetical protein
LLQTPFIEDKSFRQSQKDYEPSKLNNR